MCHNRFLRTWEVRWYNHLSAQADGESFTGDVAGLQHYIHIPHIPQAHVSC